MVISVGNVGTTAGKETHTVNTPQNAPHFVLPKSFGLLRGEVRPIPNVHRYWSFKGPHRKPWVTPQGMVRASLGRLKERYASRARELGEARLSLQEGLDSGSEALTERTEENATLAMEVTPLLYLL